MKQHHLQRFLDAQEHTYNQAYAEIKRGRKTTHWMWFIFPQVAGLGYSETSRHYAISGLSEAKSYMDHQILGKRLLDITDLLLQIKDKSAYEIFGSPDDLKLRSCMTLFSSVPGASPLFQQILDRYFGGMRDPKTDFFLRPDASAGN